MSDMLVKLYNLEYDSAFFAGLKAQGIEIKKALAPDRRRVLDFVGAHFEENYVDECRATFSNHPVTCYLAIKDHQIIGFACYEATAKNYFGPMGVLDDYRRRGVGKALLLRAMFSLEEMGYAYAIIGWPAKSARHFYQEAVGALLIEEAGNGVYHRMIDFD